MPIAGTAGLTGAVMRAARRDTGLRLLDWYVGHAGDTAAVQPPGLNSQGQSQRQEKQHDDTPKLIHILTHWALRADAR